MDRLVEQFSEIGRLQTVLLHRPDIEVAQIMPDFFDEMLLDDMPHVPLAQADHDFFLILDGILGKCGRTQTHHCHQQPCDELFHAIHSFL